jgi:hypothetical protein
MRGNVEQMEEEMQRLETMMQQICNSAQQITTKLSTKREKIEQLSGVHRLLQKLQFLVELPQRLEQAIQLEAYAQAARYWTKTEHVLLKYAQLPSFSNIYAQCRLIVDRLKTLLKERLKKREVRVSYLSNESNQSHVCVCVCIYTEKDKKLYFHLRYQHHHSYHHQHSYQ